jgi:hypothetical protein
MRPQNSFLIVVICLFVGFNATISLAQQAPDKSSPGEVVAGANLVVTSVSGPTTAIHNKTIKVTYTVENQGTEASGAYQVDLYLSTDQEIQPAAARLLKNVTFSTGLAPGANRQSTSKVLVPLNGLSGKYYYGAVVATSKKASSEQVSLARYSLAKDNDTVRDHKTGLVWQQINVEHVRDWAVAQQYCADLVLGGKADWRLPSIQELVTIIDYSRYRPALDPMFSIRRIGMGNTSYFWSGSTSASKPNRMWFVEFVQGLLGSSDTSFDMYVRCVRSDLDSLAP